MSSSHPVSRHRRRSTRPHHDKPSFGICRTQPPTFGAHRGARCTVVRRPVLDGNPLPPPRASCLADLLGETRISDEPASDAGTDYPENRLVSLLDQLHVSSELAVDLESVGSTDPMLVDSDTASLDAYLSRPICDPILKKLEGPTKDRPAY